MLANEQCESNYFTKYCQNLGLTVNKSLPELMMGTTLNKFVKIPVLYNHAYWNDFE